jgi:hypothetical protein
MENQMSHKVFGEAKVFLNGVELEGVTNASFTIDPPKKTLVKIDLRSLKPNPNAGSTVIYEPIGQDVSFRFLWDGGPLPKIVTHDKRFRLVQSEMADEMGRAYSYHYKFFGKISERLLKKLEAKFGPKNFSFEVQNLYQSYNTMTPQASHLFKHLDPRIKCETCHSKVKLSELLSDSDYDFGGNRFEYEDVCPKCEGPSGANVEYETLEAALKRHSNRTGVKL